MENLKELLLKVRYLNNKCSVSTGLVDKMEVYGFVPSCHDTIMLPLGQAIVCSDRVVMLINDRYVRFPIYQSITQCSEEMLLMEDLYVPSLFFSESSPVQQCYQAYFKSGNSDNLRKISKNYRVRDVVEVEGKWYYKINPQTWLFTSESPIRAVAEEFLVVCRRINSVTGVIIYEVFRPEDLVILYSKENSNPFGI